jgi:Protein of unknown function (DUF402)
MLYFCIATCNTYPSGLCVRTPADTVSSVSFRWGETVTRREILGYDPIDAGDRSKPWFGEAWLELPVQVIRDDDEALVIFVASGTAFTFPSGEWPTSTGTHPWLGTLGWYGHGCLMVQRPGEHYAVWHFWEGEARTFYHWYINLQTAFRRGPGTIDTQDLEVDFVVNADGSWKLKDWELVDDRVAEQRFTPELATWIREYAMAFQERLERGERAWDIEWTEWTPPTGLT